MFRLSLRKKMPCDRLLIRLLSLSVLLLSTSCAQIRWLPPNAGATADLSVTVTASQIPGTYTIAGSANLPDQTEMTIAAVRYLYLGVPVGVAAQYGASEQLNPNPTYSVLAYQTVQVNQGKWQTDLNLWQVAPNGSFQESWQLEQPRLKLALQPDANVIFLATLAPIEQLAQLEQQLNRQGLKLESGIVRTTAEGQRYAQVNQLMSIALPTGTTAPPSLPTLEADNFGWGKRYIIPFEPQNPTRPQLPAQRQTNAPSAPNEFLR